MTECYELIDVKVKSEPIQARPIAWDRKIADGFGNDSNGNPVMAVEFHTTCPHCANLIHFTMDDIHKDEFGDSHVRCLDCCAVDELVHMRIENIETPQQDEKSKDEEISLERLGLPKLCGGD